MNDNPFLSIIVICYNYEQYLKRALISIKNQDFMDYEIIYVDDASTDDSLTIARKFQADNPGIAMKIIPMAVNDVNQANILAFHAVKGKYVLKNDADDWLEPGALRAFAEAAQRTGADMVVGLYQEVAEDGHIIRKRRFSKRPVKWAVCEQQAGIYKKSLLTEDIIAVPPEYALAGDAYFVAKFCMHCRTECFIDRVVHNYFFHKNSSWNARGAWADKNEEEYIISITKIISMYEELVSRTKSRFITNYLIYAATKKYYEMIARMFCDLNWKKANENRKYIKKFMLERFPDYMNNPLIRIKENGYHLVPRIIVWICCRADRHKLWYFIYLILSIWRPEKYIKKM